MCGVFGLVERGIPGGRTAHVLADMAARLAHRGPDDQGVWMGGEGGVRVGLGLTRLSIIDVRGGRQPLSNEDGTVVAVVNGEIYNYRELRDELRGAGHRFRSDSDSEVLVHLYEEMGAAAPTRLRGMFAFALWDTRRRHLLLGRDRVGIKPLLFVHEPDAGRLVFASELPALLAGLDGPPELDLDALVRVLCLKYVPGPETAVQGVRKLPPGSIAVLSESGLTVRRYWDPPLQRADDGRSLPCRVRDAVEAAVVSHLVSDVPVGAFLSGGLDSSALVGLMARHGGAPFHTFSVGFEGPDDFSELPYAREVAERHGTLHHEIVVGPGDVERVLPALVGHLEEPLSDPAILPTYLLSRQAAAYVKVVLTGEGADELFGGYRRYVLDRLADLCGRLPPRLRSRLAAWAERLGTRRRTVQGLQALAEADPARRHLAWVGTFMPRELLSVVADRERALEVLGGLVARFAPYFSTSGDDRRGEEDARAGMMRADLATWLPDDLLLKVDRMSMAASLEARVPYLDHPLVELVSALPAGVRLGAGGKALLRQAVADLVPPSVAARPKRGLDLPLAAWFRGPLRGYVGDVVREDGPAGLFDEAGVRRLLDEHLAGEEDHGRQLWTVLTVKLWCRSISRQPAGVQA